MLILKLPVHLVLFHKFNRMNQIWKFGGRMTRKVLVQNGTGLPETAGVFRGDHTSCKWTHTRLSATGQSSGQWRDCRAVNIKVEHHRARTGVVAQHQHICPQPLGIRASEAAPDDGQEHRGTVKLYTLHKTIFKVLDSSPMVISGRDTCKYQEWGRTLMEIAAGLLED